MKNSTSLTPVAGIAVLALALASPASADPSAQFPTYTVGPQANGSSVASTAQILTPAGQQVDLGTHVRVKAVALSPNSQTAAVLTMGNSVAVQIVNLLTGMVTATFTPTQNPNAFGGSFAGITFSADGSKLYYSDVGSAVQVVDVSPTGTLSDGGYVAIPAATSIPLYTPGTAYPGGIALSPDGTAAYVTMSQLNSLGAIDLTQSPPVFAKQIPVGNAPHSVVLVGKYAYVTNEAGRVARTGDFTDISSGTPVVTNPATDSTSTGTVSIVDVTKGRVVGSIEVGLQPTGITKAGNFLYVADSFSDNMSIIDIATNKVIRTISLRAPVRDGYGVSPSHIAVRGSVAYVTLGTANAIAVVDLIGGSVMGYIPTGYFPTSVVVAGRDQGGGVSPHPVLVVTNDKGLGSRGSFETDYGVTSYNTHQDTGTVSIIPLPTMQELSRLTAKVIQNNHWDLLANTEMGPNRANPNATPVAIPEHLGEPSLIKHVFLIIKENRTYDQVLGDVAKGNGDPALAVFGKVTPNQHALVARFPLLDNFYAPSRQSADGHPWIVSGIAAYSDEIQSPDWVRSYPGGNSNDAMVYTPKGFLWQAAEQQGLTAKLYGEWSGLQTINGSYSWSDWYAYSQWIEGGEQGPNPTTITPTTDVETSTVPSVTAILDPNFPSFNLVQPDQYRVDYWLPQFTAQLTAGAVPALTIMWVMCDHTAGYATGYPIPTAEQADNDLALGRIVQAVSTSSIWGSSAIFVEEDDAQNGVDHVDGHRTLGYVISPYAVQYAPHADHTTYTALSMDRTIEQILGMKPMTQFDLVASPMRTAFTDTPNLAPYTAIAPTIPLNTLCVSSPCTTASADTIDGAWRLASDLLFRGKINQADAVDADVLNHVDWYAATAFKQPYPGEKTVRWPSDFHPVAMLTDADDAE